MFGGTNARALSAAPLMIAETKQVVTKKGPIVGFKPDSNSSWHFRGVPIGQPPCGQLRFAPPQPPLPWNEPVECFRYGMSSPRGTKKSVGALLVGAEESIVEPGDNMLHVNIITPCKDLASPPKLPVLCWVHGGSNKIGSNSELASLTNWEAIAEQGVVVVSLPYRLAMFGFLHLPAQGVTNLALKDIILGLEWVQDEIATFGGDPQNVTVWGQSSGATNLSTLLGSKLACGLIHKAIISSGQPSCWASEDVYKSTLP